MAFADTFYLMAMLFFGALIFIPLLRRPRQFQQLQKNLSINKFRKLQTRNDAAILHAPSPQNSPD